MCNVANTRLLKNFCGRYFGRYNAVWSIFGWDLVDIWLILSWSISITTPLAALHYEQHRHFCRTHRVPTLQWLFPPPSSPPSSVTKPIIIKHQYFHDSSITINISYMVGKRTAPGFIWRWQRRRHRHTQRQIQGQRQSFKEESLPVYINLVILRSNRYI